MKASLLSLLLLGSMIMLASCHSPSSNIPKNDEAAFNAYWVQGKAEVTAFNVHQSINGTQQDGKVILTFVTEDFSRKRQVKMEEPQKHIADAVKVMKCNMSSQFTYGVDQYNLMSSVYTPLDDDKDPHSLKLVSSCQDHDGQTFLQANWKGYRYETHHYSYFESEGDADIKLINTLLEDEIWNKIRTAPEKLPIGKIKMLPSAFYLRLGHMPLKEYEAVSTIKEENGQYLYAIQYPEINRLFEISFEKAFPHRILGWKETDGKNGTTTATLSDR